MSANSQNAKVMGLLHRYAERMGVPSEQLYATLLKVIFKRSEAVREEELLAFLLVCEKYGLDPFLKEIYPTLTQKQGLLPVVSVDGWLRLLHRQDDFDGLSIEYSDEKTTVELVDRVSGKYAVTAPTKCRVAIHLKNKSYPVTIEEHFAEVVRPTDPWRTHPCRMLRHKAVIQCIRVAYSFGGIYDADEAGAIADSVEREAQAAGFATTPSENNAIPHAGRRVLPVPDKVRTFESEEQRDRYIAEIIDRCANRGVLNQAVDFFESRLVGDDLTVAVAKVEEKRQAATINDEIEPKDPFEP